MSESESQAEINRLKADNTRLLVSLWSVAACGTSATIGALTARAILNGSASIPAVLFALLLTLFTSGLPVMALRDGK